MASSRPLGRAGGGTPAFAGRTDGPAGPPARRFGLSNDAVILALAAEQHGLVTRSGLHAAGISPFTVQRRLQRGLLKPVFAGVYQVGPVACALARERAAVLVCPGAVLSHWTAVALHELLPPGQSDSAVHITVPPPAHSGRRPGIRAHRSPLARGETVSVEGLPVTSLARTLVDMAGFATVRELERALAHAERSTPGWPARLHSLLARYPHRVGTSKLRRLTTQNSAPRLTRSEAEERLLTLIDAAGLPPAEHNVWVCGHEVDCYWRKAKLVVEVDGYAYHGTPRAFGRDRQRDAELAAAGVHVLRLTWHQLERDREKTLVQLAMTLARALP